MHCQSHCPPEQAVRRSQAAAVAGTIPHHDRFTNRIEYIQISIGSTGSGVRAVASTSAVAVAAAEAARVRRPARGLDGMPDGSSDVAVAEVAEDGGSAATATPPSNRSATTITANTASRTLAWCSQCVVRCHPRVASATSLIVALQIGGAFCHGNAAGFARDVAITCKSSWIEVVAGSSGSILPRRRRNAASLCSRHPAATRS